MTRSVTLVMRDAHVIYRVYTDSRAGLKKQFARGRLTREHREIHAVHGVSITLREGETLGIIGANGSGKSTLLSAMTGLLPLESGSVRVRTRPRLLGIGAALRPALSGRRNIVVGGLALGLSRREIEARMDEMIDFTDLGEFIDFPMRTYSSGMKARLSFVIATASVPDILLIDEALAVGDESFRRKSHERISELRAASGSIVLVSHNLEEIKQSCDRVVWLSHGEVRMQGDSIEVVDSYVAAEASR